MKSVLNNKLRASSLLEILVALTIITGCFAIAGLTVSRINSNLRPALRLKAINIATLAAEKILTERSFHDYQQQIGEFTVTQRVQTSERLPGGIVIDITVRDADNFKLYQLEQWYFEK